MSDIIKDHIIWAVLALFKIVGTFIFNTLKVQNINKNGILHSRQQSKPMEKVTGSLYQMIEKKAQEKIRAKGNWVVIRNGLKNEKLQATELMELSEQLSAVLISKGVRQGDCVHVTMNNNIYYHALILAIWRLGGIASCGDTALTADIINFQITETKATLVVCAPETYGQVKKATEGKRVNLLAIGHINDVDDLTLLARNVDLKSIPEPASTDNPINECAGILWSSGTTGRPKGICHSHQSIWNIFVKSAVPPLHFMMTLHFFHFNGLRHTIQCLTGGSTVTFALGEGFTLEKLLEIIKTYRPSVLCIGSHHYVQLSEMDLSKSQLVPSDLNSIKAIVPLGAAVPSVCKTKLRQMFPLATLQLIGYGQTEIGAMCKGIQELQGLGAICAGVTMKVVNPNNREICKPFEHGEICAKSDGLMLGYLNQPKSTYFDDDGFGMTGDMGFYDENGLVHYVDRIKELLKYCNNHVAPTELEDILQSHPAVSEALVFGIKEPSVQELISAVVVLKDGKMGVAADEITSYVNARVDVDFKKIRGRVIFRDSIPRNTAGKLLRREMRKWAEEEATKEKCTKP